MITKKSSEKLLKYAHKRNLINIISRVWVVEQCTYGSYIYIYIFQHFHWPQNGYIRKNMTLINFPGNYLNNYNI